MKPGKRILLTVTSEPRYDQRMIRICTSLHEAGYRVTLIGRQKPGRDSFGPQPYRQLRIRQRINSGKLFYALYNLKLLLLLLFLPTDAICAIDLDTIVPVYIASALRRKRRVYDAHELFCEMEEVVRNPLSYKIWSAIERFTVPRFPYGYTVNQSIAVQYEKLYGVHYGVVRNASVLRPWKEVPTEPFILYQGAVNKGRCFEQLIPAMQQVPSRLVVCGEGNFFEQAKELAVQQGVSDRVEFRGYVAPAELRDVTLRARVGLTLFVATSESNRLSLANRFFDYMHGGVPQLAMDYPEYRAINGRFEIAMLLPEPEPGAIAAALNRLMQDDALHARLRKNCKKAREVFCWQEEEKTLLDTYRRLFDA